MAVERASFRAVHKPWGSADLRPWSKFSPDGDPVGELWFQRAGTDAPDPSLVLKLLFTKQPLSIQVHPDDEFARSVGLAHGKTEAWYVLAAEPGAQIAVGLQRQLTTSQLRSAIEDGSISGLIQWRGVVTDDVILVPSGTIHAIGAGLVIAEIQQRSDATFRLFDYGRQREIQLDNAVAAASAGPAAPQAAPSPFTDGRSLLVVDSHFVLERFDLPPRSSWSFDAERETWLFVVSGSARIGSFDMALAGVAFVEDEQVRIEVGQNGMKALVAYPGPAVATDLLRSLYSPTAHPAFGPPQRPAIQPSTTPAL
ncbi:MAG: class I mannose-6-phosphate isomerase [Rhizomicrobium sp.]